MHLVCHHTGVEDALVVTDNLECGALVGASAVDGGGELLGEITKAEVVDGGLVTLCKGREHLSVHDLGRRGDSTTTGLPLGPCGPVGHGFELEVEDGEGLDTPLA